MTAKEKFRKVMKEFEKGELKSHGMFVKDRNQAVAIAYSEARKVNPKFDIGGLFTEQEGITDEEAEFYWDNVFDYKWKIKFLKETGVKEKGLILENLTHIEYNELPTSVKNTWKEWLITPNTDLAAEGMKLYGPSHDKGGISGIIKETEQPIEVEGGEVIINKRSMKIRDHIKCEGTPEGIASRINELEGNGIKFSDKLGECHLKKEYMKKGRKLTSDETTFIEIDGEPAISLKEFLEANTDQDTIQIPSTDISAIERLKIGEEIELGGGASGSYKVKRVGKRGLHFIPKEIKEGDWVEVINDEDEYGNYKLTGKVVGIIKSKKHQDNYVVRFPVHGNKEFTYIRSELKNAEEMKKGNKIKSKIKKDNIEEMIIRDNQLKEKAEVGKKVADNDMFIKINEPEAYEILYFRDNGHKSHSPKVLKFNFKGNDVCIYEYSEELKAYLDKKGLHYTLFEDLRDLDEYLDLLLPKRYRQEKNK